MNRTLIVGIDDLDPAPIPDNGSIVRCGPADAIWSVKWHKLLSGDRVAINLEPVDPHDIPLDGRIDWELPQPIRTAPMAPMIP
jgi:hypothetical protein